MVAVGYTSKGERLEFNCSNGVLFCYDSDLVSLEIPESVTHVWCYNNKLTELILPEGVEFINCRNNLLTELTIPKSVTRLICDKEVSGLDKLIGKEDIDLW